MSLSPALGYYYKQNTNTSKRTRLAYDCLTYFQTEHQRHNYFPKLENMKSIQVNNELLFDTVALKETKHFFIYDPLEDLPLNYFGHQNSVVNLIDIDTSDIIDEINGCYYIADNGVPAFILVPRSESLQCTGKKISSQEKALHTLLNKLPRTNRGQSTSAVCSKYTTIGAHAQRGRQGISYTNVKHELERDYNIMVKMVRTAEHCANKVLPSGLYESLEKTKELFEWECLKKKFNNKFNSKQTNLWSSIATSFDYTSAAHTDKDFFLSMLTVTTSQGLIDGGYTIDQPIAMCFVIPELGLYIGLRPGDQFIFNPLYYHCISTKDFGTYNKPVFVTSFYLKTAIVGQNNNDKEIKEDLYTFNNNK